MEKNITDVNYNSGVSILQRWREKEKIEKKDVHIGTYYKGAYAEDLKEALSTEEYLQVISHNLSYEEQNTNHIDLKNLKVGHVLPKSEELLSKTNNTLLKVDEIITDTDGVFCMIALIPVDKETGKTIEDQPPIMVFRGTVQNNIKSVVENLKVGVGFDVFQTYHQKIQAVMNSEHLKNKKWILLGHSQGGSIAQYTALYNSEKISEVWLYNSAGIPKNIKNDETYNENVKNIESNKVNFQTTYVYHKNDSVYGVGDWYIPATKKYKLGQASDKNRFIAHNELTFISMRKRKTKVKTKVVQIDKEAIVNSSRLDKLKELARKLFGLIFLPVVYWYSPTKNIVDEEAAEEMIKDLSSELE